MLRQTFARKVMRLRSVRALTRSLHDAPQVSPLPLPTLSGTLATPDASSFPLYRPPPRLTTAQEPLPDIDSLPTEDEIKRMMKAQVSERATRDLPEFKEEELRDFYKQLVLTGAHEDTEAVAQIAAPDTPKRISFKERRALLSELQDRLMAYGGGEGEGEGMSIMPALPPGTPQHVALTAALINAAPPEDPDSLLNVPLGLVRTSEWRALFDTFVSEKDAKGAEVVLNIMTRHGATTSVLQYEKLIKMYASRGQTADVTRLIAEFDQVGLEITNSHRDRIVQSCLNSSGGAEYAISVLTQSEALGTPFPQSSYNIILSHLVDGGANVLPNSHTRALALDLFTQMRFAAHPTPDRQVYNTIIRSCAAPQDPQPERARDLWLEMTGPGGIEPRCEEYNAIISALGSTKNDYLEAYDLLRQMLGKHHEATFVPFEEDAVPRSSPWVPTLQTFTALLEGTKRAGDLERARWVLNQVVDLAKSAAFTGDRRRMAGPDEELLSNVFMTYAAWVAPISRANVQHAVKGATEGAEAVESEADERPAADHSVVEGESSSGVAMPKTSAEALLEATVLFEHVVNDVNRSDRNVVDILQYPFGSAKLTPKLVNSYISVILQHSASVPDAKRAFDSAWELVSHVKPAPQANGWTWLNVMDRVSRGRIPRDERPAAYGWGWSVWDQYREWSTTTLKKLSDGSPKSLKQRHALGLGERQIEKMWAHAIRLAALEDDTDKGLKLLRDFATLYPAEDIVRTYTPQVRNKALAIRMSEAGAVAEPSVPPHLLFDDLKLLHSRLVRDEHRTGVDFVKFVSTAYQYSLGKRRRFRVRGAGVARTLRKKEREEKGRIETIMSGHAQIE